MQELKLEVGKKYINNQGEVVSIIESKLSIDNSIYYFDENGDQYTKDGIMCRTMSHKHDLIEEFTETSSTRYQTEVDTLFVKECGNTVLLKSMDIPGDKVLSSMDDTGNGYICYFPSFSPMIQNYYVCLGYDQAEFLYLMLKETVGKNVKEVKE